MTKTLSQKIYETNRKIIKWTCKAEDALTRAQAQKALRKIAKFSLRLATLQAMLYTEISQEEHQ